MACFDFKLIERIGNLAWYETRYIGGTKLKGYVVVKIRTRREGSSPREPCSRLRRVSPESSLEKVALSSCPQVERLESEFKRLVAEAKKS